MTIPFIDSYLKLLQKNRQFRYLWFSQMVSQMGDWFNLIASATLLSSLSYSGGAIGGLFLARMLPPFLLGPLAGVVADRFNRRNILLVTDLLRPIVVLGFLLVRTEQDVWLIYLLTVIQFSLSSFFDPAREALIPSLVECNEIVTANTLSGITWSTMLAVGAALGGFVTAILGTTHAFVLDAMTFALSAWFVSYITVDTIKPLPNISSESDVPQSFWASLQFLWHHPAILIMALLKTSSYLASGGLSIIEVQFAEELFPLGDNGSATLGLIYVSVGIGSGIAPLLARQWSGDNLLAMHWAIAVCYFASFTGYLLMGGATGLTMILLSGVIRSGGGGANWVLSSTMLQLTVPQQLLGRVFAFDMAAMTFISALSTIGVSLAIDMLGLTPFQISFIMGGIAFTCFVSWLIYVQYYVRHKKFTIVTGVIESS